MLLINCLDSADKGIGFLIGYKWWFFFENLNIKKELNEWTVLNKWFLPSIAIHLEMSPFTQHNLNSITSETSKK